MRDLAAVIEPTLTEPLPRVGELRARVDQELWSSVVERPLGQLIEEKIRRRHRTRCGVDRRPGRHL